MLAATSRFSCGAVSACSASLPSISYLKENMAFTCALTTMLCGLNSSVGAGVPASIFIAMARGAMGEMTRMFSNVSTDA
jgi:hypothetical protein